MIDKVRLHRFEVHHTKIDLSNSNTEDLSLIQCHHDLVMGPGQKFLTRVGSAIYGLGLNLENFP